MSYAETQFLLAEAVLRGWISGSAENYFKNGIKANLELQAIYGATGVLKADEIATYVNSVPFNASNFNEAFKAIHTQMWILFYFNWNEAFANWRRTNVPVFNDEINAKINRRLLYPQSEWNTNSENVREAVAGQGDDNVMTRIWWDKASN